MNFLSVEELIENLTILLDITQSDEIGEDIHFPREEEMYELLTKDNQYVSVLKEADRSCWLDEPVAIIWDTADDQRYWCIGFYIWNITDEEIQVDHLTCKGRGNYGKWMRQDADDAQVVHIVQVLPVQVIGEWDLSKRRSIYYVENVKNIENAFNAL